MNRQLVAYAHPVQGYFHIDQNGERISVTCNWPFDIEADDWVNIENEFDARSYGSAVADAIATGHGEARGVTGGSILLETSPSDSQTVVMISNTSRGWAARSLKLKVPLPITDFAAPGDAGSRA
jgi:hypothetical protein